LYLTLLNCIELYLTVLNCIELYWTVLYCINHKPRFFTCRTQPRKYRLCQGYVTHIWQYEPIDKYKLLILCDKSSNGHWLLPFTLDIVFRARFADASAILLFLKENEEYVSGQTKRLTQHKIKQFIFI